MDQGAVISSYKADREKVLELLNQALATEMVCVLRYKRHYEMAQGIHAEFVKKEFLEHAREEQEHADKISERINQLNGEPNLNPEGMSDRSITSYVECNDLTEMIRENLIAERIVIEAYSNLIRYLGNDDPTTRRMVEEILEDEEEHAEDLATMLKNYAPSKAA